MSSGLVQAKRRLRAEMSQRRSAVAPEQAERAARAATDLLIALAPFQRSRQIAVYAALPYELPTRRLFDVVVAQLGAALLPRTVDPTGLEFFAVERWEDLRAGCFGVLEPPPRAVRAALGPGDLVVVPGVAFDAEGYRLGQGKGYYDRAFARERGEAPTLVGFGYEFQVVEAVPHERWDRQMDAIVTDRAVRDCSGCLA